MSLDWRTDIGGVYVLGCWIGMEIVIITYEPELDFDEVEALLRKSTETYRQMEGLLQRV